ncbi:MAG TPA: glycerol-3-phosphate dehydrogenase/oxidase [Limnochordia bacterium]|nr:glycerol-3-phosphate dehydrogenase/oxidase [Limnochordia bacterium]
MQRDLRAMEETLFDVLVVGGGINGTAAARDAARRGLVVGLVEKHDFGWGTTATSTRLIHGGLRYLEHFDFALVREGLREREALLRWAPHRVKPLPFITPIYKKSRRGPLAIRVGMYLYDLLSYDKSLPSHRWLSASEVLALEPHLNPEGLTGGALYYDAQVDLPERFCIDHAREAASFGARLANYAEVVDIALEETVHHVTVVDRLTGQRHVLKARLVINAGGPWADVVMPRGGAQGGGEGPREQVARRLRKTQGIHVVVDAFTRHAIVQLAERDGRVFFVVPWRGYALIGTTDTDYDGDPGEARASAQDVAYLIDETRRYFPGVRMDPIYLTTAGVRPLVLRRPGESESQTSRRHLVLDSAPGKSWGIVTILGGKLTNHRVVAAEAVDIACRKLQKGTGMKAPDGPFFGGDVDVKKDLSSWKKEYEALALSDETWEQLAFLYGSRTPEVLELCRQDPDLARPLLPGSEVIAAQVVYAVEKEMCRRTPDFMLRRSLMGLTPGGMAHAAHVRKMMAELLAWDDAELEQDREQTEREAAKIGVPKAKGSPDGEGRKEATT